MNLKYYSDYQLQYKVVVPIESEFCAILYYHNPNVLI